MPAAFATALTLTLTLTLAAALSGCGGDTSESVRVQQSDAVKGSGKGWQPSDAPDSGKLQAATDASLVQSRSGDPLGSRRDASALEDGDDDLDAGGQMKPTTAKPASADSADPCANGSAGRSEICNTIDDDCDKKVDEDCECPSTEPVACYEGPSATMNVGSCRAGTRSCAQGMLGPCLDAVLPSAETCNEVDDDCNGQVDDLPSLLEDTQNCGRCGNVCARGESCCEGRCVNPRGEDPQHCGGCGMACTEGALPGCCAGRCVDLMADQTCGRCDNACGLFRLGGGFVCSCKLTETDGPQCVARMDNNEWLCQ